MTRMRQLRARLSRHDAAARFHDLGVDVFFGDARFVSREAVEVAGATLRFKKAVIATGSHARRPTIPGIEAAQYLTNETVFDLTERPARLCVIGGGPLGCELAQAFRRLGSEVTIVHSAPLFLPREERDAAQLLSDSFARDGVAVRLNSEVKQVTLRGAEKLVEIVSGERTETIVVDQILTGIGRRPNVENLGLETAGVDFDRTTGVKVNDFLQTTNPAIYAAGDVCLSAKFTHTADASARIVIRNALFAGRQRWSSMTLPWCTYTDPEIAHVGIYVRDANVRKIPIKTFTVPLIDVDRAVLDGNENGFVKIHVREGTDKILGATIVASHAGEMINELSLAIDRGMGLGDLERVIHPYPTQAEAIRKVADAYNAQRLTPFAKKLASAWLKWTR